jgi:sigma-B regulation protein RsbU (phosphoserine phosphatase)
VQSTLLTLPRLNSEDFDLVSHYQPATQCGGDYWDASLCGDLLTVFIGDATGHGAPAAIVTAVAKSCFATLTSIFKDQAMPPDELLTRLNRIIYNSCQGKLLMTMSIVQLDLASGELLFANAGHESPMWLQAKQENSDKQDSGKKKKGKANVLFARGERLGFSPEQTYACEKGQLAVGDILLLYTDGVSEARNKESEEWGERSLKKSFSAGGARPLSVIRKEIITAVEGHMGDRPPDDDVTFVLVAWKKAAKGQKIAKPVASRPPAMPKKTAEKNPEKKKPNLNWEIEERERTAYQYEGRESGRRKKAA